MTQLELLKEAVRLAEENPDAKVHVLACSDEILPDFGWTAHLLGRVELGYWYSGDGETIYTDPDDVIVYIEASEEREITVDEAISIMEPAVLLYTRAGW